MALCSKLCAMLLESVQKFCMTTPWATLSGSLRSIPLVAARFAAWACFTARLSAHIHRIAEQDRHSAFQVVFTATLRATAAQVAAFSHIVVALTAVRFAAPEHLAADASIQSCRPGGMAACSLKSPVSGLGGAAAQL